jgi:hypothetical protein
MQEHENSRTRRRGVVAAVLGAAALAAALPISGALASGESGSGESGSGQSAPTQVQEQPAPRDDSARNHGDCPDKDGRDGSASDTSVEL